MSTFPVGGNRDDSPRRARRPIGVRNESRFRADRQSILPARSSRCSIRPGPDRDLSQIHSTFMNSERAVRMISAARSDRVGDVTGPTLSEAEYSFCLETSNT